MKVPGENGEEVRIIAQSQFDVNHENIKIEGTDLVDSNMGSKTIFSRRTNTLAQRARIDVLSDIPWVRLLPFLANLLRSV